MSLWVVKLGGSLANSEELPKWLDVISESGAGKVVLVPGGGSWADEVREAQRREGFDDRVAHRKALRTMERFGEVLAALRPSFVPADNVADISAALDRGDIPLWMPHDMVVSDASIPETWDVTSDSLAAWLANRLRASTLLLVKSVKFDGPQSGVEEWTGRGWVDPAFAKFAMEKGFAVMMLGRGDQQRARELLSLTGLMQDRAAAMQAVEKTR